MTVVSHGTHSHQYAPHVAWTGPDGDLTGIVWTRSGLVRVTLWEWSSRGSLRQFVHFETVLDGRLWSHSQERPPSLHVTQRGAARMARRWVAELPTSGGPA